MTLACCLLIPGLDPGIHVDGPLGACNGVEPGHEE